MAQLNAKHRICIPRSALARVLKEVDPKGSLNGHAHCLSRTEYLNPGLNYSAWTQAKTFIKNAYGFATDRT